MRARVPGPTAPGGPERHGGHGPGPEVRQGHPGRGAPAHGEAAGAPAVRSHRPQPAHHVQPVQGLSGGPGHRGRVSTLM